MTSGGKRKRNFDKGTVSNNNQQKTATGQDKD
jgi:hypothetical protein